MPQPEPNLQLLRQRADLLRELRQFFDSRGFLEVQPPCLSQNCVVDPYIDPIEVSSTQFGVAADLPHTYYLQTSPEAAMKRMLAAGAPSIYSLGPVFRRGERGHLHNIEFTMLEWYQVDADIDKGIDLLSSLATQTLCPAVCSSSRYEGHPTVDVHEYRQLFLEHVGFDPITVYLPELKNLVNQIDAALASSIGDDRDAMLDVVLSQLIQPSLGITSPTIVKNYPLSQAALAGVAKDDPLCAARFELFVGGIEIANGYDELRDADEMVARFQAHNRKRLSQGRSPIKENSALSDALRRGIPQCCGVALGVDRMLMLRCGAKSIASVMPFSIEIA